MIGFLKQAARKVSLLSLLLLSYAHADYFFIDNVIQVKEFNQKIQDIGTELEKKTSWNLYMLAMDDIGEQKLIAYQKAHEASFKRPYIALIFAVKQGSVEQGKLDKRSGKVGIYGSEGFLEKIDKEDILRNTLYPLLGAKVKSDPRNKYITALYNGYAEIADQVAESYDASLESIPVDANRISINVLRTIFYAIILGAFAVYFYRRYLKKRDNGSYS